MSRSRIPKRRTRETTRKDIKPEPIGEKPLVLRAQLAGRDGTLYDCLIGINEDGISVRGYRGKRTCHAEWSSILKFCANQIEDRFGGVTDEQWLNPLATIAKPVAENVETPVAFG